MTSSLIGTWGCVHSPDGACETDRELFNRERLSGVTMPCVAQSDELLTLNCRDRCLVRVLPGAFEVRPTPDFSWGQPVHVVSKGIAATIAEICWHHNEGRYFYHVNDPSGKRLKKRYWAEDLEAC